MGRDSDLGTPARRWTETAFGCSQDGLESLRDRVEWPQPAQARGAVGVFCRAAVVFGYRLTPGAMELGD